MSHKRQALLSTITAAVALAASKGNLTAACNGMMAAKLISRAPDVETAPVSPIDFAKCIGARIATTDIYRKAA